MTAKRLSAADAKKVLDAQIAFDKTIRRAETRGRQ